MTKRYAKQFSHKRFWQTLKRLPTSYREVRYRAKLLWYVMRDPHVPMFLKASAMGALGYLICPLDAIPDAIPVGGYVDDLAVITAILAQLEPDDTLSGYHFLTLTQGKTYTISGLREEYDLDPGMWIFEGNRSYQDFLDNGDILNGGR